MTALAFIDGVWRGRATITLPSGEQQVVTHTERVGSFLGGAVKLIEGRSYDANSKVEFNALGIISYDPDKRVYSLRSYAQGYAGDYPLAVKPDGFAWEMSAGPATIRYNAVIKDGRWQEIGERVLPDKEPVRVIEINLTRLGNTDWPDGGAVRPR